MSDSAGADLLRYDLMLRKALRSVLRQTLEIAAERGLPGSHHLFITFRTQAEGVEVADYLLARYPEEMTIVLQHEFWGLEVQDAGFSVTLSFSNRHERLVIPFSAVTAFADPSVHFGLQFDKVSGVDATADANEDGEESTAEDAVQGPDEETEETSDAEARRESDNNVVTLDRFRKREG